MSKKLPDLSEKIDLQTNNPRKLFRAIADLFEDEMSKKDYKTFLKDIPTLDETGIAGVADFEGCIEMGRTHRSYTKERIVIGIIISIIGIPFFINFVMPELASFESIPFVLKDNSWIIFVIVSIAIALTKAKTVLFIAVDIEGEGYQYKGNKQITIHDSEKKERLDVVSDVRLIMKAFFYKGSYIKKEYEEDLKRDFNYIREKLHKIVPEYRIPS